MASEQKAEELDLFNKWKKTGDKVHFQALFTSMKPLLYDAAKKASFGSNVPESAHRIWAAQNFLNALNTFKPGAGASLQTHIYGAVHQKAKRLNYTYQNLGHITEPRAAKVGLYQAELSNLTDSLGRTPSTAELADRLGWGMKDVAAIQQEVHKDLAMAEGVEEQITFEGSTDEETLDSLYYELTPEEQVVYDYIFGKHGRPRTIKANKKVDFDLLAQRAGFSSSKARAVTSRIAQKLDKALKR